VAGRKLLLPGALIALLCGQAAQAQSTNWEWSNVGPAYDHFDLTLTPGDRTEAVGPFYYREQSDSKRIWALPPLLSYATDKDVEMTEFNFVHPVFSYVRFGDQYRWHLFQLLSSAGGPTQLETERNRFTLYPILFYQRSSDTNQNYTAYGPFYGHLQNRLFRDEIEYVLFPAYSRTRKKDVVTHNYLFPFFHVREGNALSGWQFWPLYGQESKGVTTATNNFGDVTTIGGHESSFVLWPFFGSQRTGLGTDDEASQHTLLPFYYGLRSKKRDQTTVVWPFFSKIDEREKGYEEWHAPWPFVVFASGPGKTTHRVLPFYSHAQSTNLESTIYLWPVYRSTHLQSAPLDRKRTRILFFLYSDLKALNTETGKDKRRIDLWPLFTSSKDFKGNRRLQILAPLEPILPENSNIEMEYSPVWSIWRAENNPTTGASSQSLLWNLYRHSVTKESREWSFLFGLFQHRRDGEISQTRLFFIPFQGTPSKAPRFDETQKP
jgi:hypothetical protein